MPQEFTSVTASSYDAAGLATKLTDKSAEGWEVVGIVTSGTEIAAFLKRDATGASTSATSSSSTPTYTTAATTAASEPAGWGTSPSSSSTSSPAGGAAAYQTSSSATSDPSSGYSAASQPSSATSAAASAPATNSVPAGWYADPAGRFDLRYWDGNTWTEHVSRAGQQFTDPPVA